MSFLNKRFSLMEFRSVIPPPYMSPYHYIRVCLLFLPVLQNGVSCLVNSAVNKFKLPVSLEFLFESHCAEFLMVVSE